MMIMMTNDTSTSTCTGSSSSNCNWNSNRDVNNIYLHRIRRNDCRLDYVQIEINLNNIQQKQQYDYAVETETAISQWITVLQGNTKIGKVHVVFYQYYHNNNKSSSNSSNNNNNSNNSSSLDDTCSTVDSATAAATAANTPSLQSTIHKLFQTIGQLPNLREFSCSGGGITKQKLCLSVLISLVQELSPYSLQVLKLSRVEFIITTTTTTTKQQQQQSNNVDYNNDFARFQQCLQSQMINLKRFVMEDCNFVQKDLSGTTFFSHSLSYITSPVVPIHMMIDSILQSLARLPLMEHIQIASQQNSASITSSLGNILPSTLQALLSGSSANNNNNNNNSTRFRPSRLQTLILKGFISLTLQHIHEMESCLTVQHCNIKKLVLVPKYTILSPGTTTSSSSTRKEQITTKTTKVDAYIKLILQNNASLEYFEMPIITSTTKSKVCGSYSSSGHIMDDDDDVNNEYSRILHITSNVLEINTRLQYLNFGIPLVLPIPTKAITSSSFNQKSSTNNKKSMSSSKLNHCQTVMKNQQILSSFKNILNNISFHLKLNQAGRCRLLLAAQDNHHRRRRRRRHHLSNNDDNNNSSDNEHDDIVNDNDIDAATTTIVTNKEWVHAMEQVTDDLSCIYYFFSLNPALYASAALSQ